MTTLVDLILIKYLNFDMGQRFNWGFHSNEDLPKSSVKSHVIELHGSISNNL